MDDVKAREALEKMQHRLLREPSLRLPEICRAALEGQQITMHLEYGAALNAAAHLVELRVLAISLLGTVQALMWFVDRDAGRADPFLMKHLKIVYYEPGASAATPRVTMKRQSDSRLRREGKMICAVLAVIIDDALEIALQELGLTRAESRMPKPPEGQRPKLRLLATPDQLPGEQA